MVAPRVYQAMAQPVVGHLDPFFFQVVEEVRTLLGYAYSTKNQFNVALSGTGSAGMEAAVANFIEPGEKFALLTNGFFGDRIGDMACRHGGDVVRLSKPWGEPFDPQEVRDFIRRERPRVVAFVQAETSTGLYNQAQAHLRSGPRSGCRRPSPIASPRSAACPSWWTKTASTSPIVVPRKDSAALPDCRRSPSRRAPSIASRRARRRCSPSISTCAFSTRSTPATSITTPPPPPCSTPCAKASPSSPKKAWKRAGSATATTTRPSSPASKPWA